jgi:hypothetical protein
LLGPEAAKEGFERDAKQHNVVMGGKPNSQGKYLQLRFTVEDKGVDAVDRDHDLSITPTTGRKRLAQKTSSGTRARTLT